MRLALVIGTLVFCAVALHATFRYLEDMAPTYTRRVYANITYTLAILLWPLFFDCLVGFDLIARLPLLLISLLWPFALLAINLTHTHRRRNSKLHGRMSMQMDVNAIAGFCFALGGLLASQMGKRIAMCTSSIFSTAFLLCLAFVMPSPEIPDDYSLSVVVETAQQAFLHYAIALLIAGIAINLSFGLRASKDKHTIISDLMSKSLSELETELTTAKA